jgi:very-short-patch-repair endonuclease
MSHAVGMLVPMDVRRELNRIAVAQHSLITLDQARQAGMTVARVRHKVDSGEWVVRRRRVYAVAGAPVTWAQAVAATVYCLQPDAWASHATAGRLWGFDIPECDGIDVLVDHNRRVKMDGVVNHRSRALFTADLRLHLHIPVTSPERTLVDLTATMPVAALGRLLDDGLRRRLVRLHRLRSCVARLAQSPGRRPAAIHELLATRLPGYDPGDSDLETRVLRLLVAAGLPVPTQQHRVRIGGRTFRIDLAYVGIKLAIELDGWEFHSSRSAFDDDRARANALVVAGWTVLRFTSRSTDAEIVACVRAALREIGYFGAA